MHQFEGLLWPTSPVSASPSFKCISNFNKLSWQGGSITSNDQVLHILMTQTAGLNNTVTLFSQQRTLFVLTGG